MTNISLVIAILAISICILLAIVVYNKTTRWIAAIIVPLLCIAVYLGLSSADDLKGRATKKIYEDNSLYLGSYASPPEFIYVWIQPLDLNEPILMSMPFTESLAKKLAQANKDLCEGKPQGVRGKPISGEPSDDEGEEKSPSGNHSLEVYDFNILIRPIK